MKRTDPNLIKDIRKYGAFDVSACFNCGNCTAVCPLSEQTEGFPRRLIRYAHLGQKKKLTGSREAWLCYYCGECAKTCPREAKPAAFMAALRRYIIAKSDITGLTGILYKMPWFNVLFLTVVAVLLGLFMYGQRVENREGHKIIEIFNIPFHFIHDMGVVVMALASLTLAIGLLLTVLRNGDVFSILKKAPKNMKTTGTLIKNASDTVFNQMFAFKRFRECDADKKIPLMQKPWLLHALTAWGFMGLFSATLLDLLFKDPELLVALWYPPRLIGTVSGILLMYGTTMIIINRLKQNTEVAYKNGTFTDWWFILMLWFIGLTGFVLEVLVYLPAGTVSQKTADILFLVHVAPAMELVVLAAYTKLAHVFYRPLALFMHSINDEFTKNIIQEEKQNG